MAKSTIDTLFRYLPMRISLAVHSLPNGILEIANEIRLRRDAPISVTAGNKNILFDENGRFCNAFSAMRATAEEINECVSKLTNGSLYTCDEFISQGFIPLAEGGRAGVCGRAAKQGFAEIYSVNLRLHRFLPNAAVPLINEFKKDGIRGTIVCSPPALGKTTFLRSAAYLLSSGQGISPARVGIADERAEIAVGITNRGLLDIISGAPKAQAITLLTRTMAPEVIICDEISASETEAVLESQNTGVQLIASAHCTDPSALAKRGCMKALLDSGIFPICVLLGYNSGYTCKIALTEDYI